MGNRPDMYMQYIQNSVTVLQQHAENRPDSAHTQHPHPHAVFIWKCYRDASADKGEILESNSEHWMQTTRFTQSVWTF